MIIDPYTALNGILQSNTALTSMLGHYAGTTIPLIKGGILAETETALPAITFYANAGETEQVVSNYFFTINCYATNERDSYLLALKIIEEFNECDSGFNGYFARTTCNIITSIPDPQRKEVNTPVSFRIVNI